MLGRALLYARTLRHLRLGQVAWRLRKKLLGFPPPPSQGDAAGQPDEIVASALRVLLAHLKDSRTGNEAQALESGTLRLLGADVDVRDGMPWLDNDRPRLWRFALHYCAFVRSLAQSHLETPQEARRNLSYGWMCDWIEKNPPASLPGWEPFVVASRLINWCFACAAFGDTPDDILRSMAQQCSYLQRNLEWDVLANHLLKDLVALVVAGRFLGTDSPVGREAVATALPLLKAQCAEQVLPDGGHYERSAMYHTHVLEDLLTAWSVLDPKPEWLTETIARMTGYLDAIRHEDGAIPLFGDAALDACTEPRAIVGAVQTLTGATLGTVREGCCALPDSGYFVLAGPEGRLTASVGTPAPAYQLAHAHCDALSYELTLGSQRVIVDAGVCEYQGGPWRDYCRSTRAHNTVQLGQREQLEFWGEFRVGRRYRTRVKTWRTDSARSLLVAEHDGFAPATVERTFALIEDRFWLIVDTVRDNRSPFAQSYVHFHPDVSVASSGGTWKAEAGGISAIVVPFGMDSARLVRGEEDSIQGWYCPEFGCRIPADVLCLEKDGQGSWTCGYGIFTSPDHVLSADDLTTLASTLRGEMT